MGTAWARCGTGTDRTGLQRVGHLHLQWLAWSWPAFDMEEACVLKQLLAWIAEPALAHWAASAIAAAIALVGWGMLKGGLASARKDKGFARWAALAVGAAALLAATLPRFVHLLITHADTRIPAGRRPA